MHTHLYYIIEQIPKVYRILYQGGDYFTRIDDEEIRPILKLVDEKSIIDYSKIFIENSLVYSRYPVDIQSKHIQSKLSIETSVHKENNRIVN